MVSFQFRQGINENSLARHENGAHKPYKTRFTRTGHQTLTYKLFKHKFQNQKRNLKLQWN